MNNVLIGAPIYAREWILPYWLEHIEKQTHPLNQLGFVFELGPNDDATHDLLWDWHRRHPEVLVFDAQVDHSSPHEIHDEGKRHWSPSKYINMVNFRNSLLERATCFADRFDYYFSLDSDLLLENPETISTLIEDCKQPNVDVVSPLSYMTPRDKAYPSIMYWESKPGERALRRHDLFQPNSLYQVDVVMAAVFMTKEVFTTVRYLWHKQGEDLGFAANLHRHKFKSYIDTRLYVPHMMHRSTLDTYLKEGFDVRKP